MAGSDLGDKTEQPTDHRRNEARRKGNVARSQDLNAAGTMIAAVLALSFFGDSILESLQILLKVSLTNAANRSVGPAFAVSDLRTMIEFGLQILAGFFTLMFMAAILVNLFQIGFLVAPEALQPKWARLNPIEGLKRLFSIRALVTLAVSLGKLAVVVSIAALFLTSVLSEFLTLIGHAPAEIFQTIQSSVVTLGFQLALALLALALLEFGFQKWKHEQDLKMTKQEVREEMKQMEADPAMRQRRREAYQKLTQARELQQVENADVVIKNPTHIAVALRYDPEETPAPVVVAKGEGAIAMRIHEIALKHGIPVIERKPLARALYRDVKVGQQIPGDMYEVFVEIMAYVYRISGKTPSGLD